MKTMMSFTMTVIGTLLLLAGCGDSGGTTPVTNESILGKWYTRSLSQHGTTHAEIPGPLGGVQDKNIDVDMPYSGNDLYLEIKADGTVANASHDDPTMATSAITTSTGTWTLAGDTITITWDGNARSETDKLSISDGTLTLDNYVHDVSDLNGGTFTYDVRTILTYSK